MADHRQNPTYRAASSERGTSSDRSNSVIQERLRSARRRVIAGHLGISLSVAVFVGLVVATIAIGLRGMFVIEVDDTLWRSGWIIGSLFVAFVAAGIATYLKMPS
ncbi:MAG: hypothetical protein AAF664_20395, partial [Planctomycetota bacterium]